MGLEGKLTDMPMLDLLRVFQRSKRSGKLVLWSNAEWALVWLREGQAVSSVVLDKVDQRPLRSGEHAIFHLFDWADGHFRYSPDPESASYPVTIKRPTNALIAEALRRRSGELRSVAQGELTLQTPLCVLPQMAGHDEDIQLSVDEWMVLIRIGQRSTAYEVATQTGMPPEQVLMITAQLIDGGLIMPVPLADLPHRQITVEPPGRGGSQARTSVPLTNLTRAIRRRLQQIAQGA